MKPRDLIVIRHESMGLRPMHTWIGRVPREHHLWSRELAVHPCSQHRLLRLLVLSNYSRIKLLSVKPSCGCKGASREQSALLHQVPTALMMRLAMGMIKCRLTRIVKVACSSSIIEIQTVSSLMKVASQHGLRLTLSIVWLCFCRLELIDNILVQDTTHLSCWVQALHILSQF